MSFRETGRCLTVEWTREQLGEGTNQEGGLQMSAPGESPTPPARPPAPAGRRRRPQPRQLQPPAAAKASSGHLGLAQSLRAEPRSVLPWDFLQAHLPLPRPVLLAAQLCVSELGCPWNTGSSDTGSRAWPPRDLRVSPPPPPPPRQCQLGDTGPRQAGELWPREPPYISPLLYRLARDPDSSAGPRGLLSPNPTLGLEGREEVGSPYSARARCPLFFLQGVGGGCFMKCALLQTSRSCILGSPARWAFKSHLGSQPASVKVSKFS